MIRSMSLIEVADAMGKPEDEFRAILPALQVLGFPLPSANDSTYSTAEILDWVARQQDINLSIIARLAARLRAMK